MSLADKILGRLDEKEKLFPKKNIAKVLASDSVGMPKDDVKSFIKKLGSKDNVTRDALKVVLKDFFGSDYSTYLFMTVIEALMRMK
jgi:hypothetical protein